MVNFHRTKKKIQLQQEPGRTPQAYISQQRGRGNESLQASLRAAEFWGDDWLNSAETTATAAVLLGSLCTPHIHQGGREP